MRLARKLWMIMAAGGVALGLAACDGKPFGTAGKAVDRAVEKTGDKIKDVTK